MTLLEEILSPITLDEFLGRNFSLAPLALPERAGLFRRLISWHLLREIFEAGHDDCWLPKEGLLPEDRSLSTGRMRLENALDGFGKGRTVLIRHSERAHPVLNAVARDFRRLFGRPVDIQLYATPAGQEGFDWHYDIEDVFVIQSDGEKEFFLRRNRREEPSSVEIPRTVAELESEFFGPEIRCLLRAGDMLYIPSGYWHKARAVSDSFHLSVGVMPERVVGRDRPSFFGSTRLTS